MTDNVRKLWQAFVEWREARRAFLAVPPVPINEKFPPEILQRLANAEQSLYLLELDE